MTFAASMTSTATRGLVFAFDGQALHVADRRVPESDRRDDDVVLGELDGVACFARSSDPPAGSEPVPLRQLFGVLGDDEFGVAGRALALVAWDRDHRYCGRCASPTVRSATERVRTCTSCGHTAYPRISPAIITLVERDGRALLARNARTRMPFFSTLAGFVEIGETLEECVVREVREEAGIEIGDVRYFGSQPWPFTGSLMVGFTARWTAGELAPDPTEIADAAWFAPHELPIVPPKLSIARALIDDFVRRHS
jgi:NAD+ diphosphatase